MPYFAEKVVSFCRELEFHGTLPDGISIMNPFRENGNVLPLVTEFYTRYYSDNNPRFMIIGINPGRFGAGLTGIPFTDTVRLKEKCGLTLPGIRSYETSSVFVYDLIERYGGPALFYYDFYVTAVSPLGFTATGPKGRQVNYNYYDSRELSDAVTGFAVDSIKKQLEFGIRREVCFCLGTGKNYSYLSKLNAEHHFFETIEPLDHPRFIMQYRLKMKDEYIEEYVKKFNSFKQKIRPAGNRKYL